MDHHGSVRRLWTIFSFTERPNMVSNYVLLMFALMGAVSGLSTSFILPWFPNSCREHGLSRWQTGVIFASMDGVMLLLRWPMVELAKRRGHRTMAMFGFAIQAGSVFGMGFLNHITTTGFFTTAVIFRCVQGVGAAMVSAAALQVMNTLAVCNVAVAGSIAEIMIGVARVMGAPLGALIFHAFGLGNTGLKMAFFFLAGLFATMAVVSPGLVLPMPPPPVRERRPGQKTPLAEMLGSGRIVICLFAIFLVDIVYGVIEPTLSIHLFEFFKMPVLKRGMLFMSIGLAGTCGAPVFGLLGEYTVRKAWIVIGLVATGFAILGLGYAQTGETAYAFSVILGCSLSATSIPALPALLWDIPQDSDLTDGEVAAVTNLVGSIAAVVGPIVGAGLAEVFGFKTMSTIVCLIAVSYGAILFMMYFFGVTPFKNPTDDFEEGSDVQQPMLQKQTEVAKNVDAAAGVQPMDNGAQSAEAAAAQSQKTV